MKFNHLFLLTILCFSQLSAQSIRNRLLVPIYFYPTISLGYDSNFLKFSDSSINSLGNNYGSIPGFRSFDSEFTKIKMSFLYSPVLSSEHETNFKFNFSNYTFGQLSDKSYSIYSLIYEHHIGAYNWFKIGYDYTPKYFVRYFEDIDLNDGLRYPCNFFSEGIFFSYSFPVSKNSWVRFKTRSSTEYYNAHFTEFDQQKSLVNFEFHSKLFQNINYYVSLYHGKSINESFNSGLSSSYVDRSYLFDKIKLGFSKKMYNRSFLKKSGFSLSVQQRLYDLDSKQSNIDDWKFYLESSIKLWSKFKFNNDIGLTITYQYRDRDAGSNPNGEFYWVEDVKDFSTHVVIFQFSYDFVFDIFY